MEPATDCRPLRGHPLPRPRRPGGGLMLNLNLFAEVEIRRLMRLHKIDRDQAVSLYLRQRIEQLD